MRAVTLEDFFSGDVMKMDVFRSKYLSHPLEYVSDCFVRISSEIANVPIETESNKWIETWTREFLDDIWRSGGSIIAGVNKKDKKISLMNCTHIPMSADTLEAIHKCEYEVSKAAAFRQGVGVDFSVLRPRGARINNSAEESEGVVHWMKSMNHIGFRVGQKGRRPAILASCKITHPDVEDVITAKDNFEELQNMNISIQITDDFMHAVQNDLDWEMKFVVESSGEEIIKVMSARDLFKKICDHAWISGDPGVQYIDLMNRFSIQKSLGYSIIGTNACSEKPLPPYGVCALASINMEKVPSVSNLDELKNFLREKTRSMVRFMDNVVEYELTHKFKSPLEEQYKVVSDLREIGLGVTNLHKWLLDQGFEYDSDEAIEAVEIFFRYYLYYSFQASCLLAKERGPCPAFNKIARKCSSREQHEQYETEYLKRIFAEFTDLRELYYKYGIRNGALLSVAPTGSLSMTFSSDILSSGIEPAIGMYYWRRTRAISKGDWDFYFVLPSAVKNMILDKIIDKESEDYQKIASFPGSVLDNDGAKGEELIAIIKKYLDTRMLKNAFEIDPNKKIEMISRVQRYVDAAISVTFNVPNEITKEEVQDLFMTAYNKGIKAMTIFRDGVREGVMFFEFPKKKPRVKHQKRPDDIEYVFAPKRPKELKCDIFKVLGHYVMVGLLNGKPFEMFIIESDKKLPDSGCIVKVGNRKYRLTDCDDRTLVENLIDEEVTNDKIQAITRLTSSNLRHGVPIDFICEQLSKCGDSISSYPKMLGRVLRKYKFLVLEQKKSSEVCPNCGNPLVVRDGCIECLNCTYTKCGG